jgi:hypothetical protein
MYAYAQDFGYDGSDPSVIYAQDVSSDYRAMHDCSIIPSLMILESLFVR